MGTHPIFESDFDCLTDIIMRRLLSGRIQRQILRSLKYDSTKADLSFRHGLPVITVTLPSRKEPVSFTCRPVTGTIGDLLKEIKDEDKGVDHAAVFAQGGVRLASATTISQLLTMGDFQLRINDTKHEIQLPSDQIARLLLVNEDNEMAAIKQLVNSLHSSLGIAEFQYQHHSKLRAEKAELKDEIDAMKPQLDRIEKEAEKLSRYTHNGLMYSSVALGAIMARLTWWEYSWDVMEPCTFFVTYGGAILWYSYYLATQTMPGYQSMSDRWTLHHIHRLSRKHNIDIDLYKDLKHKHALVEENLIRLEDELQLLLTEEVSPTSEEKVNENDSFLDF